MKTFLHRLLGCLPALLFSLAIFSTAGSASAVETITYFHNDIAGTPILATDAAGAVLWKENYRPYGDKLNNPPAGADNKLGFTGKPYDPNTGLSYMGARYYDPVIGRFTGIDPVDFVENNLHSFNRYTYGNNNPYKYVDPDGRAAFLLIPIVGWMATGAVISGGVNAAGQYISNGEVRWSGIGGVADAAGDGAILGPVLGIVASRSAASTAAAGEKSLPDSALVCRGGTCTAEKFSSGSGVTADSTGKLQGVSVNSSAEKTLEQLTVGIPNKQVGVTTVGNVRRAGGNVTPSPTATNPDHCTLCGITPQQAERLMTPTKKNPNQ